MSIYWSFLRQLKFFYMCTISCTIHTKVGDNRHVYLWYSFYVHYLLYPILGHLREFLGPFTCRRITRDSWRPVQCWIKQGVSEKNVNDYCLDNNGAHNGAHNSGLLIDAKIINICSTFCTTFHTRICLFVFVI